MAIAGSYTVRSFDVEQMLSGEKGLLGRNEIAWNVFSRGHELYLAKDCSHIDGPGNRDLFSHQLAGSALGGRDMLWGRFNYNLLAVLPLYKPQGFHTSGAKASFSLSLEI